MHEAGAAVVAAQLLAFYKEPVRYRPRLTHGREHFGGGLTVFRFAQGKFSHALMRDLTVGERERLRVAAAFFVRQVCLWDGATHYQVLCVPQGARRETIKEHYHGLIALLHPDRQEAASEHWPAGAAQRVNQAYAVLSDDDQRAHYDAGLHSGEAATLHDSIHEAPLTAAARTPVRGRFALARIRMRKPVLVFSAVVASLFFAQVWWFGELPHEYTTLASATPFDLSSRWVRDVHSSPERPRFMAGDTQPGTRSRAQEAGTDNSVPFLTPLWRALSTRASDTRALPRDPDDAERHAPPPPVAPPVLPTGRGDAPAPNARTAAREANLPTRDEPTTARPEAQPARAAPLTLAQAAPRAAAAPAVAPGAPSSLEMETLVARVVTYYESGDLDRLLALYDSGSLGFWEAIRIRNDFQEFFRATRARRLRLERVSWDTAPQSARARGVAALYAEYPDQPGARLERNVELELDVVVRDGQPRIARLSLYPHAK